VTESQRLVDALTAAGWQEIGMGPGYVRLALVASVPRHMLVVPLDESAPEFEHMMDAAFGSLERLYFDGKAARNALNQLKPGVYR
jgi:hypothetical protein